VTKDGFAAGNFHVVIGREGKQDEKDVREPGVEGSKVQTIRQMVSMDENEDVEVEKIETVAAFSNEEEGAPGKDRRDRVGAAEAKDERGKERHQKTTMHDEIRHVRDGDVKEQT
jgi:hypothetical protein